MSAYFRSRTTSDAVTTNVVLDNGGLKLPIFQPESGDKAYDGSLRFNSAENAIELSNNGVWEKAGAVGLLSMTQALNTFATVEYMNARIAEIINNSPASLDTLKELATALGNDANYAATTAAALGNRLRIDTATQILTPTQKTNARTNLGLAAVASSGSYADLSARPTNLSQFTNDSGYITRTQLSGGTGVTYNSGTGVIGIGQPVGTTDNVTFNKVTANEFISTGTGVPTFRSATNIILDAAGTVVIDSPVSLRAYTTTDINNLVVQEGTVSYDSTVKQLKVWNGSAWVSAASTDLTSINNSIGSLNDSVSNLNNSFNTINSSLNTIKNIDIPGLQVQLNNIQGVDTEALKQQILDQLATLPSIINQAADQAKTLVINAQEFITTVVNSLKTNSDLIASVAIEAAKDVIVDTQQIVTNTINTIRTDAQSLSAIIEALNGNADFITAIYSNVDTKLTPTLAEITSINAQYASILDSYALISTTQTTQATQLTALANQITDVVANTGAEFAAVRQELSAATGPGSALATQISSVVAQVNQNTAGIVSEQTARVTATSALASDIQSLSAVVGGNTAAIQTEITTRASETEALSQRIDVLAAATGDAGALATIQQQLTALTTADSAMTTQINTALSSIADNTALINTEATTRATADSALATQITTLSADTGAEFTAVRTEITTATGPGSALATSITQLATEVNNNKSAIETEVTSRTTADSALATQITTLATTVNANTAAISSEQTARVTAIEALATTVDSLVADVGGNTAAITTEQTARATADSALSSRIDLLVADVGDNTAAIQTEATARADADSALASRVTILEASNGNSEALATIQEQLTVFASTDLALTTRLNAAESTLGNATAAIQTEENTRATADSALSSRIDLLVADVGDNTAAIATESTARADADSALASQITTLITTVNGNSAAIQTEVTTRANADEALSTQITTLAAQTADDIAAAIQTEATARTDADSALASQITILAATVANDIAAAVQTEATARADADSALASQITTLISGMGDNAAAIQAEATARADADGALATQITNLAAQTADDIAAAVLVETTARADADTALATQITNLSSKTTSDIEAAVLVETTARTDADSALATQITNLASNTASDIAAAVLVETTARTDAVSAVATSVSNLTTTVNGNSASISTQQTTLDGLSAQYTVKLDTNGYISGFGLASTAADTPSSEFVLRADKFKMFAPGASTTVAPFSIDLSGATPVCSFTGKLVAASGSFTGTVSGGTIEGGLITLSGQTYNSVKLEIGEGQSGGRAFLQTKLSDNSTGVQIGGYTGRGIYSTGTTVSGPAVYGLGYSVPGISAAVQPALGSWDSSMDSDSWALYASSNNPYAETFYAYADNMNGAGHAIRGHNTRGTGTTTSGLVGAANGFDFYADSAGNYGPFTGSHDALIAKATTVELGDIVVDVQVVRRKNISNTITEVQLSSQPNEKGSVGVVAALPIGLAGAHVSAYATGFDEKGKRQVDPQQATDAETYDYITMNSVGEGQINVCGLGGNLEPGDLITSSSIPGKGQKQSDDIIRSYTVAKCRETVVFDSPNQVKLVSCIYLCG